MAVGSWSQSPTHWGKSHPTEASSLPGAVQQEEEVPLEVSRADQYLGGSNPAGRCAHWPGPGLVGVCWSVGTALVGAQPHVEHLRGNHRLDPVN